MTSYQKHKEAAREEARAWQNEYKEDISYLELAEFQAHFEELAKKYGLTKEFKENGII